MLMRRRGVFPLEETLLAQWAPGFVFAVGWTAMYEIYHEDGSYFSTLLQEILGAEGMFPYFLLLAGLLSFPIGMMVDAIRHVVGEIWLGLPRGREGRDRRAARYAWTAQAPSPGEDFDARFLLYRHACATMLAPAKAAGNLALVLLVMGVWFVVKIIQVGSFRVFSAVFVVGTPLLGLTLIAGLVVRYVAGLNAFCRQAKSWGAAPAARTLPGGDAESIVKRSETLSPTSPLTDSLPSPLDNAEGQS
jgi:hypothetical protein